MKAQIQLVCLFFFHLVSVFLNAAQIYVSPNGNDSNVGSIHQPVQSLEQAQALIRARTKPTESSEVILAPGTWHIRHPLTFHAKDGHTTWRAQEAGTVTISGGMALSDWKQTSNGVWVHKLSPTILPLGTVRELFVKGQRRLRARSPNEGYFRVKNAAPDKRSGFEFHPGDIAKISDLSQVELVFLHDWSITRVGIRSIDSTANTLQTTDPIGANARHYSIDWFEPHPRYFLENASEFLDQPGEWFHNTESGTLHYLPLPGESIDSSEMIIPIAKRLIDVKGTPDEPVRQLHFAGLQFEHCQWQIPAKGYAEGQANYHEPRTEAAGILREIIPAAVHFELAVDCSISNSTIRRMGGGGVWFGSRTQNCALIESEVTDISGNGVLIGEDQGRQVNGQSWWQSRPDEVARDNRIVDCRIHDCGKQFYGAVGIWVGFTQSTHIVRNEIFDLPYTGVSLGWMWNPTPTPNGNNRVEENHIHHVMQILSDGGGIYTLGRQPGTVLRANKIHDVPLNLGRAESNGMFLDEGTTEILVEDNMIYGIDKSPIRFHQAGENMVRNNVLIVKPGIPPIRYNNTPEVNIHQQGNWIAEEKLSQPAE